MRIEEALARLHEAADLAAARGSLIFHLDLAAEVARAALAARGQAANRIAVTIDEQGYRVFALDAAAAPDALAEVRFDTNGDALILPPPDRLPQRATAMAQARTMIAAAYPGHAAIAVPASDRHARIEGYAIAIGDDPDDVRLDGHRLLALDAGGRRLIADEPLGVTGPEQPTRDLRDLARSPLVVAAGVPNELHTYLSLKHDLPLLVRTDASGLTWRIDGERSAPI